MTTSTSETVHGHCGLSLLRQYIVFGVLVLMQLGGCTRNRGQGRGYKVKGDHYLPALGSARLCAEACAQGLLRGAQRRSSRHQLRKGKFPSDIIKSPLHSKVGETLGQVTPEGDVKAQFEYPWRHSSLSWTWTFPEHDLTIVFLPKPQSSPHFFCFCHVCLLFSF